MEPSAFDRHSSPNLPASERLRRHPSTGDVLARLTLPDDVVVSGLEAGGQDVLYAGGGPSGRVRAIRRPRRR